MPLSEGRRRVPGHSPRPEASDPPNALSFDVEDWFHAQNYEGVIPRSEWDRCEFRAVQNTRWILDILEDYGVRATFFVLGWVAERAPEIVTLISEAGHELGTHGFWHRRVGELGPEPFRADLNRSLEALTDAGARRIRGFRAPSFSITARETWAFDILRECGLEYDSSVVPTGLHPTYGIPDAPLAPHRLEQGLWEVPLTVLPVMGRRVPVGGGAYFRIYPYRITAWALDRIRRAGRGFVVYLHPWELDSGQPRPPAPRWRRARQTLNVGRTEGRLRRLLQRFPFGTIEDLLAAHQGHVEDAVAAESAERGRQVHA